MISTSSGPDCLEPPVVARLDQETPEVSRPPGEVLREADSPALTAGQAAVTDGVQQLGGEQDEPVQVVHLHPCPGLAHRAQPSQLRARLKHQALLSLVEIHQDCALIG